MNCAEAGRILGLVRAGELDPGEERALEAHLKTCPACSAERASFLGQRRRLETLRSIVPAPRNPEESIRAILNRVRSSTPSPGRGLITTIMDGMIGALEVPGLRYALAVFVTVMVSGFVLQQVSILKSVTALEARLSQPEPPRLRMAYTVPPADLNRLARSGELQAIFQRAEARGGTRPVRFDANRAAPFLEVLNTPGSRLMLRTLLPGLRDGDIDTLVTEFSRNVQMILTYSKGEEGQ